MQAQMEGFQYNAFMTTSWMGDFERVTSLLWALGFIISFCSLWECHLLRKAYHVNWLYGGTKN